MHGSVDRWRKKKRKKKKSITFFAVCIWKVSLSCRCTVEIRGRKGGRERERGKPQVWSTAHTAERGEKKK